MNETDLLHTLIERAPHHLPVRVFRRNIINDVSVRGHRLRNGIKGQADAYAIGRGGKHIEIETKAARGAMREAQEAWRAWCVSWGIPHLVLKAAKNETPEETVGRWIEEMKAAC